MINTKRGNNLRDIKMKRCGNDDRKIISIEVKKIERYHQDLAEVRRTSQSLTVARIEGIKFHETRSAMDESRYFNKIRPNCPVAAGLEC
jgi:hypothetical protein